MRIAAATLVVCVLLAAVACAAAGSGASELHFAPGAHRDAVDVAGGPLDLTSVTFGQEATQLVLRITSSSPWGAGELSHRLGRRLCLTVSYHADRGPQTRICVVKRAGRASLNYAHLDANGVAHRTQILAALISRPDDRTLSAAFTPLAAGLPHGQISWQAESTWTDETDCPATDPCVDDVPDVAPVIAGVSLLAEPRCFGAASRDSRHRCHNPALDHAVIPTPDNALITPNAYCKIIQRSGLASVCAFGATPGEATRTIALIGDSHSEHWRGAMEVVAQARHWRGLSISRSSCPFTMAPTVIAGQPRRASKCVQWNHDVRQWLGHHPEVRTVFVSAHQLAHFRGSAQAGYRSAWAHLPSSVRRIIVIHDNPETVNPQTGCVNNALARHRISPDSCAGLRSNDLHADPEADAAYKAHSRRIRVINLNRYMCGRRLCFAVIGGALVRKDNTHLTSTFSTTLGPYLLRAVNRIIPGG